MGKTEFSKIVGLWAKWAKMGKKITPVPYIIDRFIATIIEAEFHAEEDACIYFVLGRF